MVDVAVDAVNGRVVLLELSLVALAWRGIGERGGDARGVPVGGNIVEIDDEVALVADDALDERDVLEDLRVVVAHACELHLCVSRVVERFEHVPHGEVPARDGADLVVLDEVLDFALLNEVRVEVREVLRVVQIPMWWRDSG